jgi:hypothetical protein
MVMSSNPTISAADTTKQYQNVVKPEDYKFIDLTGTDSYAKAKQSYADSLSAYTDTAMKSATTQGLENVYGAENTYGAMGAGGSGAAQAAQARGMATPIAQAQEKVAGLAASQQSELQGAYTGMAAPAYQANTSNAEVQMMNKTMQGS